MDVASKGKKPRKKKPAGKGKPDVDAIVVNGLKGKADDLPNHDEEAEPDTPIDTTKRRMVDSDSASQREHVKVNGTGPSVNDLPIDKMSLLEEGTSRPQTNLSTGNGQATTNGDDTAARLEALAKERNALMEEVSQLRKSLEGIQEKHEEEIGTVRDQLEEVQGEKDQAESQYRTLLGKVNTIKSQLGERLKADAVCFLHRVMYGFNIH